MICAIFQPELYLLNVKEHSMRRITLVILSLVCVVILYGCSKTETNNNNSMASNTARPAMNPAGEKPAMTAEKIGVPECDDFIAKYDACVSDKVPAAARAQYKSAVAQWRASWKKLADNPSTKGSLAAACKQAAEQQAAALKAYGCSF